MKESEIFMKESEIFPVYDRIERQVYLAEGPIDFETWLKFAHEIDSELVRGVVIHRMAAQYPHEWIFAWLLTILRAYVSHRQLGHILGSRTPVKINKNDGRLPDILFVRAENAAIIHKKAIYGVPDVVIEIVSENDRPSDLVPLEADYQSIGVPEIAFIDPKKRRVRYLRNTGDDYHETPLTTGRLTFAALPGFHIEVEWLFADPKPDEFTIARELIEEVSIER